jgi:integrase
MKAKRERNLKQVGGRWFFDFSKDGKRYIRLGGRTKEEAKDAMARLRAQLLEGPQDNPADVEDPRFRDFAREYLEVHARPNKRSWQRDERTIARLNKTFGDLRLSELSLLRIEKYRVERLGQVAIATTNRELSCLKAIISKAIDWEKLASFPLRKIKIDLRLENRRTRVLSSDEEPRLLAAASAHLRPLIVLALQTGMRRGEILKLRAEHVDFKTRRITVPKENSKSKKQRFVPMNSKVVDLLSPLVPEGGGFVFRKKSGQPYDDVDGAWRGACARAKIADLRFHDLRHTFETRGIESGVNLADMREIMGHATIDFSLDHYYHADAARLLDEMEKLALLPAEHERKYERLLH